MIAVVLFGGAIYYFFVRVYGVVSNKGKNMEVKDRSSFFGKLKYGEVCLGICFFGNYIVTVRIANFRYAKTNGFRLTRGSLLYLYPCLKCMSWGGESLPGDYAARKRGRTAPAIFWFTPLLSSESVLFLLTTTKLMMATRSITGKKPGPATISITKMDIPPTIIQILTSNSTKTMIRILSLKTSNSRILLRIANAIVFAIAEARLVHTLPKKFVCTNSWRRLLFPNLLFFTLPTI